MDTGHFGVTPTTLSNAILDALSALQMATDGQDVTTGCVRTIGRLRDKDKEAVAAAMHAGTPAILLLYQGFSTPSARAAHGQLETDVLSWRIYCIAGYESTAAKRQDGGDRDAATATEPGVEDLQDWVRWYALRALNTAGGVKARTVSGTQTFRITPEHFIGWVNITCERELDIYDDDTGIYLTKLGIVHDPTNGYGAGAAWFESDNLTPISDWPSPGVDGGVATL